MKGTRITSKRPTLNEIAVEQDWPYAMVLQAVKNRRIPIKDGRIERQWVADVIFEGRILAAA